MLAWKSILMLILGPWWCTSRLSRHVQSSEPGPSGLWLVLITNDVLQYAETACVQRWRTYVIIRAHILCMSVYHLKIVSRLQERKWYPGLKLVSFIHKSYSQPALFPNVQKKLEKEDQLNPKEVNKAHKSEIEK